jgi:hypothetical protein
MTTYQNEVLNEREKTHGDYANTARCAAELKQAFCGALTRANKNLAFDADAVWMESCEMIMTKLARIASGDHNEIDHYRDIAGYANLVSERLK